MAPIPAAACITATMWPAWRDASAGNAMPPRWPAAPWNGAIRSCRPPSRRCGMAAWYRGADAVELARASQLEDVAAVLWESGDASVDLAAVPAGAAPPPGEAGAIQPGIVAMAGRCRRPAHAGPVPGRAQGGSPRRPGNACRLDVRIPGAARGRQHQPAAGGCLETTARGTRHPAGAVSAGGPRAQCLDLRHARDDLDGRQPSAGILSGLATLTGPLHAGRR